MRITILLLLLIISSSSSSACQYQQRITTTRWRILPSERAVSAMVTRHDVPCRLATTNDSPVSVDTIQSVETVSAANRSFTTDRGQERPFTSRIPVSVRFTVFDTVKSKFNYFYLAQNLLKTRSLTRSGAKRSEIRF